MQGLLKEPFSGFSTQQSPVAQTNGDFPCRQPFFLSCVDDDDADDGGNDDDGGENGDGCDDDDDGSDPLMEALR